MNCLARCAESDAPLCCLADFLVRLKALEWSDESIAQVEAAVLRFMRESSLAGPLPGAA